MKGFGLVLIEQTHLKRVPQFRRIGNVSDNIPNWDQVLDSGFYWRRWIFIGGTLLEMVTVITTLCAPNAPFQPHKRHNWGV